MNNVFESNRILQKSKKNHSQMLVDKIQAALRGWHKEKEPGRNKERFGDGLEMYIPRSQLGTDVLDSMLRSCWDARCNQLLAAINSSPSRLRLEFVSTQSKHDRTKPVLVSKFVNISDEAPCRELAAESAYVVRLLDSTIQPRHYDSAFATRKIYVDSESEVELWVQLMVWLQLREDHGCHVGVRNALKEGSPVAMLESTISRL